MQYLIFVPFVILLAIYCYTEKLEKFWIATILKVTLSAYVAIVAISAAIQIKNIYAITISIGLICAVPADFFLQYIKSNLKMYRFGILFFGGMHVALLIAFFMTWGVHWQEFLIFAIFIAIFIAILTFFQKSERWKLGKEKNQLSLYTVLVVLMASKSISIGIRTPELANIALALGGLFFFLSDLFLGIWDYYKEKFRYLLLNRVIYFIGQLLLAFSLVLAI